MKLLAINCGSSTLKFRLYEMPVEQVLMKGSFDAIGLSSSNYSIRVGEEKLQRKCLVESHEEAVHLLLEEIVKSGLIHSMDEIEAIGHRVVHGGNKYSKSVVVTNRVLEELDSIKELAPLHNPASLAGVHIFMKAIPHALQVVCFDTAFHQSMEEKAYLYPIPYEWYVKYDIRKYGFHGLSHQYITLKMADFLKKNMPNLITCHIGNGGSICAIKEGVCVDTSMGFTPNAGIMMGTRSGDIDYSLIGYVMSKTGLSYQQVDHILNKESGLQGITGMSDLRDIDRAYLARDRKVMLSIEMYTRRVANYIGNYYLLLDGKVDAICFTAGGGENDDIIREEVIRKLHALGIILDVEKNKNTIVRKGKEGIITTLESSIPVYVVATDEELMIARDTYHLANGKENS